MWSAYYASVSFMDQQIGRIIEHLDASGLAETTAVVFTSDHGYHLGEHTMWQKSNLHEEVTRIPLMISVPGSGTGRTNSLAELVDIYPTLVNALGQDIPTGLDGKSLLPVLSDGSQQVREYAISFHNGASLRGENWAYMRYTDGTEELYDMQADPKQYVNLAQAPEHRKTLQSLRTRLQSHQGYQGK
jgi:iduronate 2-sulfatase